MAGPASSARRVRLSLNVNVQNLTNHTNFGGYVYQLTSPSYGLPTTTGGVRKFDIGLGLSF